WNALGGGITVGIGASVTNLLQINGAAITNAGTLIATNSSNRVVFNGGFLGITGMVYSNGTDFVVGDGTQAAALKFGGGTATLQNNLIVTNNGMLTGIGNIVLAGGSGSTYIRSNATIAPGNSPGTITNIGNMVFEGGGRYLWEINNFNGTM